MLISMCRNSRVITFSFDGKTQWQIFQRTRYITSSPDKHYSLDFEDDFRLGRRNVSHQQQFFSELPSHGPSHYTNYWYSWVQTIHNDRCFYYFTVAMLVSLQRAPTWRLHTELYKFGWNTFPNNARMNNRTDLNRGEVVYISIIFHIPASWLIEWLRFLFWWRDNANQPFTVHLAGVSRGAL